jgi:hypothetical protein
VRLAPVGTLRSTSELLLAELTAVVAQVPREDLLVLLGELERLRATGWLRLAVPSPPEPAGDTLLTAKEAAKRLSVPVESLYRKKWPFTVRLGKGTTRYSERGIERFIRARESR